MQVQCSTCGGVVPAADVNLDRMLAKCGKCNSVFDISSQVPAAGGGAMERRHRRRVALPSRVRVLLDEPGREPGPEP